MLFILLLLTFVLLVVFTANTVNYAYIALKQAFCNESQYIPVNYGAFATFKLGKKIFGCMGRLHSVSTLKNIVLDSFYKDNRRFNCNYTDLKLVINLFNMPHELKTPGINKKYGVIYNNMATYLPGVFKNYGISEYTQLMHKAGVYNKTPNLDDFKIYTTRKYKITIGEFLDKFGEESKKNIDVNKFLDQNLHPVRLNSNILFLKLNGYTCQNFLKSTNPQVLLFEYYYTRNSSIKKILLERYNFFKSLSMLTSSEYFEYSELCWALDKPHIFYRYNIPENIKPFIWSWSVKTANNSELPQLLDWFYTYKISDHLNVKVVLFEALRRYNIPERFLLFIEIMKFNMDNVDLYRHFLSGL